MQIFIHLHGALPLSGALAHCAGTALSSILSHSSVFPGGSVVQLALSIMGLDPNTPGTHHLYFCLVGKNKWVNTSKTTGTQRTHNELFQHSAESQQLGTAQTSLRSETA